MHRNGIEIQEKTGRTIFFPTTPFILNLKIKRTNCAHEYSSSSIFYTENFMHTIEIYENYSCFSTSGFHAAAEEADFTVK